MLLIHPPAARPSEPPSGIAKLSAALTAHDMGHTVLDANIEAIQYLTTRAGSLPQGKNDKWTVRALRNAQRNYESLQTVRTYQNSDRYKRAVIDLDHALKLSGIFGGIPGIANFRHERLSPLRSDDLLECSKKPEENPYYEYFSRRLPLLIEDNSISVVGFSMNYLSQALSVFAMAGFIKKRYPEIKIVLGGGLVSSWMSGPHWKDPFGGLIDHMISGQGEGQLLSYLGIKERGEQHLLPDYGLLSLDSYLSPVRVLPYSASTGCYWNKCSFCPEKAEGNPYVSIPAAVAVKEIPMLVRQTGAGMVHLLDNAVSPALLKALASEPPGVPWYGFARVSPLLTDYDFCVELRRSGCLMLKLGIESGAQDVLDRMNKGIELSVASKVLSTLKKSGISTYVYLIFGTPEEDRKSAGKTLEFTREHKDYIDFLNIALFNMPLSGKAGGRFETTGFYEGDLSLYTDFVHPRGWNRIEVRRFLQNEFKKEQAIAKILRNDPPIFTSNHAPFIVNYRG